MASMYPKTLENYNPTVSEQRVFEALKTQLDDTVSVFYSISWISSEVAERSMSEIDFLIIDPEYGYLVCEVKGGTGIRIDGNVWHLIDGEEDRVLKRTPFEQAEASMRYLKRAFELEYNYPYMGIFGAVVMYPNFSISDSALRDNRPAELTIDYGDMCDLKNKIRRAFIIWRGSVNKAVYLTDDQRTNLLKLMKKRIAISAAAGALIENRERQLTIINRVQDNYIHFMKDFTKACIIGGAGTGKTFIAMKLAERKAAAGKSVVIIANSPALRAKYKETLTSTRLSILAPTDEIMKYDVCIVDEGQDLESNEVNVILSHCFKDASFELYYFADPSQRMESKDGFDIVVSRYPTFYLRENLRNTASIHRYAMRNTKLGLDVITNTVEGPEPESIRIHDIPTAMRLIESDMLKMIDKEYIRPSFITLLVAKSLEARLVSTESISRFSVIRGATLDDALDSIRMCGVNEFKGLESNVIFYLHDGSTTKQEDYIAYTRARYYLKEYIVVHK